MHPPHFIHQPLVLTQNAQREVRRLSLRLRDGRIAEIGESLRPVDDETVVDGTGLWLMPGLIQCHLHLTQTLFRGMADDLELLPWLSQRIWPLEAAHNAQSNRLAANVGIAELLLSGTTTILDMGTTRHHDSIFEAAAASGIRYVGGKAMMDKGDNVPAHLLESTAESLAESDRLFARWHGAASGRIRYAYTPRFILSCSDDLLAGVADRSRRHDVLIHTHASESRGEVAEVTRLTGHANAAALLARGCLGPRSVIAHGVWIADQEEELFVNSGAALCHCPGSNLKLASGIAPIARLRTRGVRVGLGSDGSACNNTLDAFFELRLAGLLQRLSLGPAAFSAQDALDLATIEGAKALNLDREVGTIEVGKKADVILIEPSLAMSDDDPVGSVVYGAHGGLVRHVFVDGVELVRDGKLLRADISALKREAVQVRKDLRARAGV